MVKPSKSETKASKKASAVKVKAGKAGKNDAVASKLLSEEVSDKVQSVTLTIVEKLGDKKMRKKEVQAAIAQAVGIVLVENKVVEEKEVKEAASSDDDSDDSSDDSGESDSGSSSDDESDTEAKSEKKPAAKAEADSSSDDSSDEDEAEESSGKRKATEEAEEAPKSSKKAKEEPAEEVADHSVFIGGISWDADDTSLHEFLNGLGVGSISSVRIMTDRESGRSKGFGYADCSAATQAKLCANTSAEFLGRTLRFDATEQKKGGGAGGKFSSHGSKPLGAPADSLFVGNLAFGVTEDDMYAHFEGATNCRVATDRETGEPRGFGHVSFGSIEEATAAMEKLAGSDLKGRTIRLDFAGPRGGGGGGGGGEGALPQFGTRVGSHPAVMPVVATDSQSVPNFHQQWLECEL
eukprot:m.136837 g.136837  ORF g.136837 m.136837 type:complete len:408 (-) comp13966_c0_seq1:2968-4191(-)